MANRISKTRNSFLKEMKRQKNFLNLKNIVFEIYKNILINENLIIPKVISYLEVLDVELLLMEWIDMQNSDQTKAREKVWEKCI